MRKLPSLIVVGALGAAVLAPAVRTDAALSPYYAVELLSRAGEPANGASTEPMASDDGRFVAFTSAADNLIADDTNTSLDVFVLTRSTGAIARVSLAEDGSEGSGDSYSPSISDDGRFVAFLSDTELVAADENGVTDAFVRDRDTDEDGVYDEVGATTTIRVSEENGLEVENAVSDVRISGNGQWAAVVTDFGFLNNDQNEGDDVYVREVLDLESAMRRISRGSTTDGGGGDLATISDDGRFVGFRTFSFDVAPGNVSGYYVRDRDADVDGVFDESGTAQKVTVMSNPVPNANVARFVSSAAMSGNGRFVSFTANGTDLVAGAVNNSLYLRDRDTDADGVMDEADGQSLAIVSQSTAGVVAAGSRPAFSPNNQYLAFESPFPGLVPAEEPGTDIFVRDLAASTTARLDGRPSGLDSNGSSSYASVDDAGNVVFAATGTNLVADDGNGVSDVFESRLTSAPAFTYTVRISEEDYNKALQAAAFYGTTVDALAQRGTWTLAFIVKRSGGSPSPAADQPNDGPVVIHTTYTADNDWITGYITDEFALSNGDDMHVLGLRFMIFAWMLETGQA